MKVIDLFSGIGGFSLAGSWMGWETIAFCEIDKFCQRVLKYYWPNTPIHEDITNTDFTIYRGTADVLTGGFPCQPYSLAGKRKGTEDNRHLWPQMLRAIREAQPTWVVGENVPGLVNWSKGLVFEQVQADLENEGYEVQSFIIPACAKDAPHRRDRVWIVAYSISQRKRELQSVRTGNNLSEIGGENSCRFICNEQDGLTPNPTGSSIQREYKSGQGQGEFRGCDCEDVTNPDNQGLQGGKNNREPGKSREKQYKQSSRFIFPNWQNFPTQSPICHGNDGLPDRLVDITFPKWRNESIKSMGNSIVPQVVFEIFKTIELYENPDYKSSSRKVVLK